MDGLDIALLCRLGLQPFSPPERAGPPALATVAGELGISVEVARQRVGRMEAEGIIAGYEVYPNFRHLGVTATTYHFRVGDGRAKSAALEDVRKLDGVVGVFDFVGPTVCVDVAYRHPGELERRVHVIARLLGARADPHPCFDYAPREVARRMSHLDWRIVRALRGRAKQRPEEVALAIGVSARTVRRHVARLVEEGSIDIVPVVDTGRLPGFILYELLVTLRAPEGSGGVALATLASRLSHAVLAVWFEPGPRRREATLLCVARSVAETEDQRREAERLPGVAAAEVLLLAGSVSRSAWIDEAIEARVRETAAVSRSAPASARM